MPKEQRVVWVKQRLEFVAGDLEQEDLAVSVMRLTRSWIQYGVVGFTVFCIVMAAVLSLLGR